MNKIVVWADGGTRGNQYKENIGGWGALLQYKEIQKELYGGEKNTTNNKQELTAVIKALEYIQTTNIPIEINVDSNYVYLGMTQWLNGWIKKDWINSKKQPVKNKELWIRLKELANLQDEVRFIKVRGHSDNEGNNRADELANKAMDELKEEN